MHTVLSPADARYAGSGSVQKAADLRQVACPRAVDVLLPLRLIQLVARDRGHRVPEVDVLLLVLVQLLQYIT